jgi:hypothetical protein
VPMHRPGCHGDHQDETAPNDEDLEHDVRQKLFSSALSAYLKSKVSSGA